MVSKLSSSQYNIYNLTSFSLRAELQIIVEFYYLKLNMVK